MRRCPDCGETKPLEDFVRNRAEPSGRHWYCKPCWNARVKAQKQRLYGGERNFLLSRRYGISTDEVIWLINEQGLLCPLCQKRIPNHVDHDHVTGAIRGILCFKCNGALGKFDDDPARIRSAIEYLSRHDG